MQLHLMNDSSSFHPVHTQIRAIGPQPLHHAKGRGPTALQHPPVHLRIEPRHPLRSPKPLSFLPCRSTQGTPPRGIFQHPADCRSEGDRFKWLGKGASDAVGNDVGKATGVEGHHRGAAGVGFEAGVGQVVLAGGDHHRIRSAVEGTQAEVVVEMACVMHREAELELRLGGELAKHHQLQVLQAEFVAEVSKGS